MGRKAELIEHVGVDALRAGYRGARRHAERSGYQALWVLARGADTARGERRRLLRRLGAAPAP